VGREIDEAVEMSAVNPNDAIRNQILHYFFVRNTSATSRFGRKGSAVKISDEDSDAEVYSRLPADRVLFEVGVHGAAYGRIEICGAGGAGFWSV
jgi:hypothetical protein